MAVRIFLACFLTPDSAQALRRRAPAVPGMREVPAANLHVTLHFLGGVRDDRLDAVRALTAGLPAAGSSVMVRELTGFPKPDRARVLVVRLEDGEQRLRRWHTELATRWPTAESRRFDPHATLARSRQPVALPMLPDVTGMELQLEPPAAYVSETGAEGARYRPLRGY